jgi:hypothetical protein
MEATCSSEASVDIQRTTRRYIPEDISLKITRLFLFLNAQICLSGYQEEGMRIRQNREGGERNDEENKGKKGRRWSRMWKIT